LNHGAAGSIPPLSAAGFANFQACVSCPIFAGPALFFLELAGRVRDGILTTKPPGSEIFLCHRTKKTVSCVSMGSFSLALILRDVVG